jgi:ubiquinone/menaquinone biosynthesis C-methylase UbiE
VAQNLLSISAPRLFRARGVVVDMGFGSGTNLPHFDAKLVTKVIAIEPNPAMLARKRENWRTDIPVESHVKGAEDTGLPSACADTVVFTYALCTIPDCVGALDEARRLLRPGGQLLFCEHGLAPDSDVAKLQRTLEPFWKVLAGGCHLTRNTETILADNGFVCETVDRMYLPGTPRFGGYNVWGTARP